MKMKKVFKILSAVALLASSLVLGSCSEDDEIVQVLQGPANVWCRMPVDYTSDSDSSSTAKLYAHFYYTDTEQTIGNETLPAGITIVVTAFDNSTSTIISSLTSDAYLIKSFPKDEAVSISEEEDDSRTLKGTREKWTAFYWGKDDLHKKANQSTTPPSQLYGDGSIKWDEIKNVFSWKKLLANYLLSILEE